MFLGARLTVIELVFKDLLGFIYNHAIHVFVYNYQKKKLLVTCCRK
jgi:hypothetical protein